MNRNSDEWLKKLFSILLTQGQSGDLNIIENIFWSEALVTQLLIQED